MQCHLVQGAITKRHWDPNGELPRLYDAESLDGFTFEMRAEFISRAVEEIKKRRKERLAEVGHGPVKLSDFAA
jgi:hypothetical protein